MEAEQAASRAATAADEAVKAAELMEAIMGVDLSAGRGEWGSPATVGAGVGVGGGAPGLSEMEAGEEHGLALALQRAFVQARVQGLGKPAGVSEGGLRGEGTRIIMWEPPPGGVAIPCCLCCCCYCWYICCRRHCCCLLLLWLKLAIEAGMFRW